MKRSLRTTALFLGIFLIPIFWGCTPATAPWRLDRSILRPAATELDWSLGHERLARALSAYQRADYVEARSLFLRVALETDTVDVLDRTMLGAILSGLLSAENVEEVTRHLLDFDNIASEIETDVGIITPDLLRPILQFALAFHEEQRSNRKLRDEFEGKSRQIAALKSEISLLRTQIQELEALFQFLEQQKRQLTIPGSVR
ncbi:hypothetical protein [Desulfonatronum thioautotrophicum]|uniref:hypothetical protein n=1 Tax=Desulfonatronum thioautotrophicum TaxID=617001 RepID=UPI0005EB0D3A|nr:hypothetical protein [Desulfonatronum thioautotrophicum]